MDVTRILDPLNTAQREAVTHAGSSVLVLAGAGSGKTRVLVHRIAWLLAVEGVSAHSLLAVTFTNKAAQEMRARVEQLLELSTEGLWIGTFHGMAHRLLRRHYQVAGLPQSFQILDADDQQRMVKRVIAGLGLDESRWPPKQAAWFINSQKDEGRRPQEIADKSDPTLQQLIRIYTAYQENCRRAGAVDFAELLLRALEILRDTPDLLSHYQQRFRHILVDEFQDTNRIQYAWLRLLAGTQTPLFAVGDDDQSIYGWRGARVENILNFNQHFPCTHEVRLEQNYRSTQSILAAANAVIAFNAERKPKTLWSAGARGEAVTLYAAYNEIDEARFVLERIREWGMEGGHYADVGVLYRSNAQSRVLEEQFVAFGIPYRVYGGQRFFERAEIKDALAYLRLAANRADDASFERVVNQPPRGLGERSVAAIRERARNESCALWAAATQLSEGEGLSPRAGSGLREFLQLIRRLEQATVEDDLASLIETCITDSGLREHFARDRTERGQARRENLDELVNAGRTFQRSSDPEQQELSVLDAFLAQAVLESGETQGNKWDDCAQMMTLHSAKGLEFQVVFLVGLEEGLFPHQMSMDESGRLEEERRLCYVGMTRAKQHLVLSYAERRRLHGRELFAQASRFVGEIPDQLIQEIRPKVMVQRPAAVTRHRVAVEGFGGLQVGQRVRHQKFGEGVVLDCEGQGESARVQVNFESAGAKWLVLQFAKLQPL